MYIATFVNIKITSYNCNMIDDDMVVHMMMIDLLHTCSDADGVVTHWRRYVCAYGDERVVAYDDDSCFV